MTNRRPLTALYVRFSYTALSIVDVHRLIGCGQIIKATVYQSFFCHCHIYGNCMCCKPITTSAVCCFPCQVFGNSRYPEISVSGSHTFPLFPYTHTYSVIEPSVNIIHVAFHTRYSIVVKPPSCIYFDSF